VLKSSETYSYFLFLPIHLFLLYISHTVIERIVPPKEKHQCSFICQSDFLPVCTFDLSPLPRSNPFQAICGRTGGNNRELCLIPRLRHSSRTLARADGTSREFFLPRFIRRRLDSRPRRLPCVNLSSRLESLIGIKITAITSGVMERVYPTWRECLRIRGYARQSWAHYHKEVR